MSAITRVIGSVVDAGREILALRRRAPVREAHHALVDWCEELLEHRGEASGMALASDIASGYRSLAPEERLEFFIAINTRFDVDRDTILAAADLYRENSSFENLYAITRVVKAPHQKLFRRINMAPGGTSTLVAMRGHLLGLLKECPELQSLDSCLRHLFISWFNKGFLQLERVDWSSPAVVLDKIIDYEAVHEINGWDDLRNRLREDRRCFAFFHPAMPNDPLVFVEVALTAGIATRIGPLLDQKRELIDPKLIDSMVFYSISNCHPGLAGVSFGNFLIKHVVEELRSELPGIKNFVTLSPIPGFLNWLRWTDVGELVDPETAALLQQTLAPETLLEGGTMPEETMAVLMKLCAHYLLKEKSRQLAMDPVARFHLGNGATLHQLNWAADRTPKGLMQSAGIMVNYLYNLRKIEINHDRYFDKGQISASKSVRKYL